MARVAGKTERIGRPRPLADLDHDLRNVRPPGNLPAPPARTGTRAHVPAQVRTDLPAHQCETTATHAAPGEPGETTSARPRPAERRPPTRRGTTGARPEIRSQSVTQPGRRRAQVAAVRRALSVIAAVSIPETEAALWRCGGPVGRVGAGDRPRCERGIFEEARLARVHLQSDLHEETAGPEPPARV
jgi:hypothetical protein